MFNYRKAELKFQFVLGMRERGKEEKRKEIVREHKVNWYAVYTYIELSTEKILFLIIVSYTPLVELTSSAIISLVTNV